MPAMIQHLVTKDGTTYTTGLAWPGAPNEQLKVGPIFFVSGEEEPLVDEDGDVSASISQPPCYEVWCVDDRFLSVFVGQLRGNEVPPAELQHVVESNGAVRRLIYLDFVATVDEQWPAVLAFEKLVDRYTALNESEDEDSETDSESTETMKVASDNGRVSAVTG